MSSSIKEIEVVFEDVMAASQVQATGVKASPYVAWGCPKMREKKSKPSDVLFWLQCSVARVAAIKHAPKKVCDWQESLPIVSTFCAMLCDAGRSRWWLRGFIMRIRALQELDGRELERHPDCEWEDEAVGCWERLHKTPPTAGDRTLPEGHEATPLGFGHEASIGSEPDT